MCSYPPICDMPRPPEGASTQRSKLLPAMAWAMAAESAAGRPMSGRMSSSRSGAYNRQVLRRPSAISRSRLQRAQKWSETPAMKPIVPRAPGTR